MSAMEVLETVVEKKIPHKHPLTAMIWTNEEGSLYPPVMMSSGVVCYDYLPPDIQRSYRYEDMMKSVSMEDGKTTFESQLKKSGFVGAKENRMSPENTLCDFETHIEQGPILDDAGKDLGVVDCVLGMYHYRVRFYGQTTHAGTFPMPKRKDAFLPLQKHCRICTKKSMPLKLKIWCIRREKWSAIPISIRACRIILIFHLM